ncbi:MAG: RNA 3'-terminal phosphate cyclase [Nitrospinales bacterium]
MKIIDGSMGEGGGQVLRTSLALSMVTGTPFRLNKIRAGRGKPGLLRQHLTCVNAATEICGAEIEGNELGSQELIFNPGTTQGGDYSFSVGSAGSACLVCQTVLPPLMISEKPSTLTIEGGTHNDFAPPFDFIKKTFVPIVNRMGPKIEMQIERYGFFPAGGGKINVQINPEKYLTKFDLTERGKIISKTGEALFSHLSRKIASRELTVIGKNLSLEEGSLKTVRISNSVGPGNIVSISIESEHVSEVFTGFGKMGVKAESVASSACGAALAYLNAGVPVGKYLADQLLIPMALARSGRIKTMKPSEHTLTNIEVIKIFMDINFEVSMESDNVWEIATST